MGTDFVVDTTQTGIADGSHGVMSKLLLNLRNVPDDEADDMRALLDAKRIAFHETAPSPWAISVTGIRVTAGK